MIMTLLFLTVACNNSLDDTAESMPVEVISCSHPDSRFEGVVFVEVEDEITWNNIYFEISQGEHSWKTELQTEDKLLWWTRMQLYELDCYNNFEHGIIYGSR
jgi:hypothetical protein